MSSEKPTAITTCCCDPWKMGNSDTVGFGFLGGGAWIAQILWQYYIYMPSRELLLRILVLMRRMATFYRDMLIETPQGLSFPFGASPEMNEAPSIDMTPEFQMR